MKDQYYLNILPVDTKGLTKDIFLIKRLEDYNSAAGIYHLDTFGFGFNIPLKKVIFLPSSRENVLEGRLVLPHGGLENLTRMDWTDGSRNMNIKYNHITYSAVRTSSKILVRKYSLIIFHDTH